MERSDFIKSVIGLFGASVLPSGVYKEFKKIYLLQSFVRGFCYYEGPSLLDKMQPGQLLELVHESDNKHDKCAIALYFNSQKIGFIPREDNQILSKLMDAEVLELLAEITHIEPKAETWENVRVAIYLLKETENKLPPHAQYLTELKTPKYRTLNWSEDRVGKIYEAPRSKKILNGEDFYKELVKNSKTDSVYDLIHENFSPEEMEHAVEESRIVIDRKKLPQEISNDDVIKALDEKIILLEEIFGEDGYVVANINRLAEMPH